MTKRKIILATLVSALAATIAAYASILPGRNVLREARLVEFDFRGIFARWYAIDSFHADVDRTYSFAFVESASPGILPACTQDLSFCLPVQSEATTWLSVVSDTGETLYSSRNYGVLRSGPYTFTYAFLPPAAIASQGRFFAYVILPLMNVDGSRKTSTPFLTEWTFTNF